MTTKFAAFFLLAFLYSASTSRFLLLIFSGSVTDKACKLLVIDSLTLVDFCCFTGLEIFESVGYSKLVMLTDADPPSSRTFGIPRFQDNIVRTWF
jgi:hypothetical protein